MPAVKPLWPSDDVRAWKSALDAYDDVVAQQGVASLVEHDRWYRTELPKAIAARRAPHIVHGEIVRATEWKMARGVWRARNLVLVKGNDPKLVIETSTDALAKIPHPSGPIASLAELAGVGPATASAIAAAASPETYPFFDELVAAQVPKLGEVAWTLGYYRKYAEALQARSAELGGRWTPVMVERALWSHVGGKAGGR